MQLPFDVGRNGTITSLRVVRLKATHADVGDLEVHLISPAGTDVIIVDRVCGGSANLSLDLDDAAGSTIPCPPTDGLAHTPSNPVSAFLGERAAGTWTVQVFDRAAGNTGYLNDVAVEMCADCGDSPQTMTFDAATGPAHCFSEGGLNVCAYQVLFPFGYYPVNLQLGDNDGNASPDLANSSITNGTLLYTFSLGVAPFAVTGFDFTYYGGTHSFSSAQGGFAVTTSGHVTPPGGALSGITSFNWYVSGGGSPGGVMDNLAIVAQCCGDGILDPGEQCEDGNLTDDDCCSRTCQFDPSGAPCQVDGNVCTQDTCNGGGACAHPDKPPPCALVPACGAAQPPSNGPPVEHPKIAKKFTADLVQAFVACIFSANTTTEGGLPACSPPRTPNEKAGSPPSGWRWAATASQGQVGLKPLCPGAGDLGVTLKLAGIVDGAGVPASGHGTLGLNTRLTLHDPVGGNMTANYPVEFGFTLIDGKVNVTTTLDAMLSEHGIGPLPTGISIEIVSDYTPDNVAGLGIKVLDANGNTFAVPGIFLP